HLATQRADRGGCEPVLEVDDRAAILVDGVIVADHAHPETVTRIDQHLPAGKPAIAFVASVPRAEVAEEAVALVDAGGEARGHGLVERARDVALEDHLVVIAVSGLGRATERELRLLRGDRDDAGGCVLAEQRRLRATKNLDALDVGEVGDLRGRARSIDVVHEDADRRLDTGIVGAVTEAADEDRKSTRLNSSHVKISYAVFCLKK